METTPLIEERSAGAEAKKRARGGEEPVNAERIDRFASWGGGCSSSNPLYWDWTIGRSLGYE